MHLLWWYNFLMVYIAPNTSPDHEDMCNFIAFSSTFPMGFSSFDVLPLSALHLSFSSSYPALFFFFLAALLLCHTHSIHWQCCIDVHDWQRSNHGVKSRTKMGGLSSVAFLYCSIFDLPLSFSILTLASHCRPVCVWETQSVVDRCTWYKVEKGCEVCICICLDMTFMANLLVALLVWNHSYRVIFIMNMRRGRCSKTIQWSGSKVRQKGCFWSW